VAASPQKDLLVRFYEIRERTLDQRGTTADVDKLLALLTPDAKYEHPTAGVVMSKDDARSGITAHLREGTNARYTFRRARFAKDFAVVELTLEYTIGGKVVRRIGTSIFEFKGNKISRVAEY
jgi:ketosteroid isomerase-like protein